MAVILSYPVFRIFNINYDFPPVLFKNLSKSNIVFVNSKNDRLFLCDFIKDLLFNYQIVNGRHETFFNKY